MLEGAEEMTITTEAAERLAERLSNDAEAPQSARYQPYTDHAMCNAAAALRSLAAERDALKADLLAARNGAVAASENAGRMMEERNAAWQEMEGLKAENARLQEALNDKETALLRVAQWTEAYPEDIFPPVDLEAAREKLGDDALFSRLHAEWARHLCKGIGEIVRAALGETQ